MMECRKKASDSSLNDYAQVTIAEIKGLIWWHLAGQRKAKALIELFQKLDRGNDGFVIVRDALQIIDAAISDDDIVRRVLKETVLQNGVLDYKSLNLEKIVRYYR